jgi:hypothetical protein
MWSFNELRSRQGTNHKMARVVMTGVGGLGVGAALIPAQAANAQSPKGTFRMSDKAASGGFPSGANAVVVEGLGITTRCSSGGRFKFSKVENATVNFINTNTQVITEITPQPICGSKSAYKNLIKSLTNYVYGHASHGKVNRFWGGLMLDEERNYTSTNHGFSAPVYKAINTAARSDQTSHNAGGATRVWTENGTASWGTSAYKSTTTGTRAAPQAYGSGQVRFINGRCSSGYNCLNLLTIGTSRPKPYNNYSSTQVGVHGSAPFIQSWGTGAWYNKFNPV